MGKNHQRLTSRSMAPKIVNQLTKNQSHKTSHPSPAILATLFREYSRHTFEQFKKIANSHREHHKHPPRSPTVASISNLREYLQPPASISNLPRVSPIHWRLSRTDLEEFFQSPTCPKTSSLLHHLPLADLPGPVPRKTTT